MTNYSVYCRVGGDGFNLDAFVALPNISKYGERVITKRIEHGMLEQSYTTWRTRMLLVAHPSEIEAALLTLIDELHPALAEARQFYTAELSAVVVHYVGDEEEVRGLYLSRTLIKKLSDIQADWDLDIVRFGPRHRHSLQGASKCITYADDQGG